MKILSVVGARPNFMKIAPFIRAIDNYNSGSVDKIEHILVHTGQHYDIRMSDAFFKSLSIPDPDINLEIGSGSHAEQLGNTMIAVEKILLKYMPDWVVVVGDVNATLSCSVVAKRLCLKVCHIEAGLRSGDMSMPEEINRLVTDRISDLLLTPDRISSENLLREGISPEKVRFVGNIMIDTLEANRDSAQALDIGSIIGKNHIRGFDGMPPVIKDDTYGVITLHRPSNVDSEETLKPLVKFLLSEVAKDMLLIWPIHPRALKNLKSMHLWDQVSSHPSLILLEPVNYHEMLRLNMGARIVFTDSGGLQEECCVLGTPCLTLRWNTERPVTLREHGGVSVLVGNSLSKIRDEYHKTMKLKRTPSRPELWDGKTAERIIQKIVEFKTEARKVHES